MIRFLTILVTVLFFTLSANGQDLFFIGEQSFTITHSFILQSNSDYGEDLKITFGKDGDTKVMGVSAQTGRYIITGKLIIYLENGMVITLEKKETDLVDGIAKAAFYFSEEQLNRIKDSNINTIRYTLDADPNRFMPLASRENFTVSNKGNSIVDFPDLVTDFFERNKTIKSSSKNDYIIQQEKSQEIDKSTPNELGSMGDLQQSRETENSLLYELQWEGDKERAPMVQPLPENTSDIEATVTIRFEVKPDGKIGRIVPIRKMNPEIEREVLRTLRSWRFSSLPSNVPQQSQWGTITFRFMQR